MKSLSVCFFLIAVIGLQAQPAPRSNGSSWSQSIGAGMLVKPEYKGSSDYEFWPVPYYSLRYKDWLRLTPWEGLQIHKKQGDWVYSASIAADFGRDEDDNEALKGMGDIDTGFPLSLGMSHEFAWFEAGIKASYELSGIHDGYEWEGFLQKNWRLPSISSMLQLKLALRFADENALGSAFGVSQAQSIASGHPVYTPRSGLQSTDLSGMWIRTLNPRWSLVLMTRVQYWSDEVAESPIVESDASFFSGCFLVRSF
jgi:outer membrane protein